MEEMARSIAIFFPPNLCSDDSGRLWLRHLQTSEGRISFLRSSLTHTRDRDGTKERERRERGWDGWCRRSVKLMALTGEVDFVWGTWPGSRFSHLSRYTKTSSIGQCIPLQARVGIAASY